MEFALKTITVTRKYPSVPKIPEKIDAVHIKTFKEKPELRHVIVHKPRDKPREYINTDQS